MTESRQMCYCRSACLPSRRMIWPLEGCQSLRISKETTDPQILEANAQRWRVETGIQCRVEWHMKGESSASQRSAAGVFAHP
jgi:hypothetical protein